MMDGLPWPIRLWGSWGGGGGGGARPISEMDALRSAGGESVRHFLSLRSVRMPKGDGRTKFESTICQGIEALNGFCYWHVRTTL